MKSDKEIRRDKYIEMLDEFINFNLAKAILDGEKFGEVDGDIGIEKVMEISSLEEKIVDLIIKGFKENKESQEQENKTLIDNNIKIIMEEKYFYIDGFPYYFKGKTFGGFWNGWSCPYFTKEVCKGILKAFEKKYEFKGNKLIYFDDDYMETIRPNEEGLYGLGAYSWVWNEIGKGELEKELGRKCEEDIVYENIWKK